MRSIAIVNQKGGCGKTTTAINLGGSLARDGHRVLIVDMDPQAHSCLALGIDPHKEYLAPGMRPMPVADKKAQPIRELLG